MEEKEDILKVVKEGFAEVRQQFAKVDQQFAKVDQQFAKIDQQFAKVDQQFAKVDQQFGMVDQQFGMVDQGFAEVRQQFAKVDQQFANVDQGFAEIRQQFARVDQQFASLREEFAGQLEIQSTAFHTELNAGLMGVRKVLHSRIDGVEIKLEKLNDHVGLVAENVANVNKELAAYHARIEAPVEQRVSALDVRVTRLEGKDKPSKR